MRDADVASRFCSRYHSSMTYHPEKTSEVPTLSHGYPRRHARLPAAHLRAALKELFLFLPPIVRSA